jgi:hypothetical protein
MFCANCGAATGGGNFCSVCGASLREDPNAQAAPVPLSPDDWADEVRYSVIVEIPAVRDRIAANATAAAMTAEPLVILDSRTTAVMLLAKPIALRMGFRTGKERAQLVSRPIGWVLADVLCLLARSGYPVLQVQQGTDGCVLECVLPSDLRAHSGEMVITVERTSGGTAVRAVTNIPGQLIDWGKSRQALDQIFADLA